MEREKQKPIVSRPTVQTQANPRPAVPMSTDSAPRGGRRRGPRGRGGASDSSVQPPGQARAKTEPNPTNKLTWLTKSTGKSVTTISSAELRASTTPVSSNAGFELLCTYNWVSTSVPTIYVPGGPPKWTPVAIPTTLPKDTGTHFIDQNTFRASVFPFEPMFAAMDVMKPDCDLGAVHLVTNRNSLRKLLNFASGRVPESFRIDVNMVHDTMFLTRRERSTRDLIQGNRNAGYGHNFEKAFTKVEQGLEESNGHHRVVRYRMGELDCVVRFEVDAWCGGEGDGEIQAQDAELANTKVGVGLENEDLLAGITKLSLSEVAVSKTPALDLKGETGRPATDIAPKPRPSLSGEPQERKTPAQYKPTHVIRRGRVVPWATLAEIKTRKDRARLAQALPQLWFGRTPLLLHARHDEGRFAEEVACINAGDKFEDWEKQQQEVLCKMVGLIKELRQIAMQVKDGACVVVCEHKIRPLRLEVFESTAKKRVLPEDIVGRYWREGGVPSGS